jgi:hypothetical protein
MRLLLLAITIVHIGCANPPKAGVPLLSANSQDYKLGTARGDVVYRVAHNGQYQLHRLDPNGVPEAGPPIDTCALKQGDAISFGVDETNGFHACALRVSPLPDGTFVWSRAPDSERFGPVAREERLQATYRFGKSVVQTTAGVLMVTGLVCLAVMFAIAPGRNN